MPSTFDLAKSPHLQNSSIVDQCLHMEPACLSGLKELFARTRNGKVCWDCNCCDAVFLGEISCDFFQLGFGAGDKNEIGTAFGELTSQRLTNAPRRTSDECCINQRGLFCPRLFLCCLFTCACLLRGRRHGWFLHLCPIWKHFRARSLEKGTYRRQTSRSVCFAIHPAMVPWSTMVT